MKKNYFIAVMLLIWVSTGCKKEELNEFKISPIEIGKIENHIVTTIQAEKIASLHSIYPEKLKKTKIEMVYRVLQVHL